MLVKLNKLCEEMDACLLSYNISGDEPKALIGVDGKLMMLYYDIETGEWK